VLSASAPCGLDSTMDVRPRRAKGRRPLHVESLSPPGPEALIAAWASIILIFRPACHP
jgi:hypothetical protein